MIEVANLWVLGVSPLPVDYYSGRKSIDGRMRVATEPRRLGRDGWAAANLKCASTVVLLTQV
jgi:hypothetical protein